MALIAVAGFAAGTSIAIVTVLTEHYGPTFGKYALFGNGALIVPALLVPFAIFVGWTWVRRRRGLALEMAVFVIGLHFGIGVISLLDALLYPSSPDITIRDALPGFLLTGTLFVIPAALLAAGAYWLLSRLEGVAFAVALLVIVAFAAFLAGLFGAGLGLLAGAGVVLAGRMPQRQFAIGAALFVAIVVLGNLTYLTLLFALPS